MSRPARTPARAVARPGAVPTPDPAPRRRGAVRGPVVRTLHVLLLPLLLVGVYAYASAASGSYYTPTPDLVAAAFVELWFSERFLADVLPSLARLLTGSPPPPSSASGWASCWACPRGPGRSSNPSWSSCAPSPRPSWCR